MRTYLNSVCCMPCCFPQIDRRLLHLPGVCLLMTRKRPQAGTEIVISHKCRPEALHFSISWDIVHTTEYKIIERSCLTLVTFLKIMWFFWVFFAFWYQSDVWLQAYLKHCASVIYSSRQSWGVTSCTASQCSLAVVLWFPSFWNIPQRQDPKQGRQHFYDEVSIGAVLTVTQ